MTTHTRTLKLKVFPTDKETKPRINQIISDAWRAANWIASGQYLNDQFMQRVYARKKIDTKDKQNQELISEVEAQIFSKDGFFGTKRQATTERDIKQQFPDLPSTVTNTLNQIVTASYRTDKKALALGEASLRTYKKTMPVPIAALSIRFTHDEQSNHFGFTLTLGKSERVPFQIVLGKDKGNFRHSLLRILANELDYGSPQIQKIKYDYFLLLPVKDQIQRTALDSNTAVGVDLGINIPAYASLNNGKQKLAIGSRDDFLRIRLQMQNRRRQLQRSVFKARPGKGRSRKLKAINNLRKKERNFAHTYNHMISYRIIQFALTNNAGVIKLEWLEGIARERKNSFVLRNWSYFELQAMIQHKAKKYGIEVAYIDPKYTSQICSECGNLEEGQRPSQSQFICKACEFTEHADYNAARNIAKSDCVMTTQDKKRRLKDNEQQKFEQRIKKAA